MDALNSLIAQLRELWRRTSITGRVVSIAAVATVVATMAGVAVWSARPDYKLLREGISPVLTAEIVSVLDANGIPNRMNYSGSGVLVPTSRWNDANVAIASLNVPDQGVSGTTSGGGFMEDNPSFQDEVRLREQALERSIQSYRAIRSADVHLAVPEPSPFIRDHQPASASVVLETDAGQVLSRELVASVVHTVASAVEGLQPEDVSVSDASGHMWGGLEEDDPVTKQRRTIRELEVSLVTKAQEILSSVLGPDQAVVRVTAQVDAFVDRVEKKKVIDSTGKVTLEETLETSDQKGMPLRSGGAAGTSTNGGTSTATVGASQTSEKTESIQTQFDYPETTVETRMVGGQPIRLSVAAVVDVTPEEADPGSTASSPLTQEVVEDLIKDAVGFDEDRGDQITVTLTEFAAAPAVTPLSPVPDTKQWEFMGELARNASLGLAAVVALLIGVMTIKQLRPIEVATSREDERQRALLAELSSRVDQNPEAVSKILASWLGNQAEGGEGVGEQRKAA